ncbi:hypothetical protein PCANC_10740 [Puccinia coronata f. sp. avenae]|uniref:Uncharacterized protein n=1 Tax=Puccinia coronata f. sp. avenae TaxID=200324 RepID=A0A2N5VSU7_9BASI|nr:hypothetical protein PCANC_10740 [Puccinia coronata f. sp. avenae]
MLAMCVNKTWLSPPPSPHLRLQPMQPHWRPTMTGFYRCRLMLLVLLSLWLWSTRWPMSQFLQLPNPQAMRMLKCTMAPTLVIKQMRRSQPLSPYPSQQLHCLRIPPCKTWTHTQDDIVEVINLAQQLADRIGSTAEGSSTQDPAEPGQPASTTESGVPQPESSTSQAPLSSESTDAAPAAVPSQRVTIMINRAEVDIINTGIDPTFLEALPDGMRKEFLNQHLRATASARRIICPGSVEYKYQVFRCPPPLKSEPRLFALKLLISSAVVAKIKHGTQPRPAVLGLLRMLRLTRPLSSLALS